MKRCPNCKSDDLIFLPWAGGMLWECRNCGYRGPIVLEDEDAD